MSIYPKKHPVLGRSQVGPSGQGKVGGMFCPNPGSKNKKNPTGTWANNSRNINISKNSLRLGGKPTCGSGTYNKKQSSGPTAEVYPRVQCHPPIETNNGLVQYYHKIYKMKQDLPSISFRLNPKPNIHAAMRPPIVLPDYCKGDFFPRPQSPITIDDCLKLVKVKPLPPTIKQLLVKRSLIREIIDVTDSMEKHTFAYLEDSFAKKAELDKLDHKQRTRFIVDLCGYEDEQISIFAQGRNLIVEASKPAKRDTSLVTTRETIELPEGVSYDNLRVGRDVKGYLLFEEAWKFS